VITPEHPWVWLNGRIVPAAEATVSVFDRSFLYGDGLFETIRIYAGKPFAWADHWQRLEAGARFLSQSLPCSAEALAGAASELIARNAVQEGLLRITLSRGVGRRGYSPRGADHPVLVLTTHPAMANDPASPIRWRLMTSRFRVATGDALSVFKTANKLTHVMARAEAEAAGADEALLLNSDGHVTEAASANVFWLAGDVLRTPPLPAGVLAGVTRARVVDLAPAVGLRCEEVSVGPADLLAGDGVFLTLSSLEIVPVVSLDGVGLRDSPWPRRLHEAYRRAVALSTG
jgi:branched-chain amino acid aminotransferase